MNKTHNDKLQVHNSQKDEKSVINNLLEEDQEVSPGMQAWGQRVLAGIKRMNEDEEFRKKIARKLR